MMETISGTWRVLAATFFSAALIVGVFLFVRDAESPQSVQASAETALLQAIATKDSDGDGLPDWEEALYGADPNKIDTFSLGMTDGEAVSRGLVVPKAIADIKIATSSPSALFLGDDSLPPPPAEGTITAAFASNFFTLYLAAKQNNGGANLSEADMQNIASEALSSLSSEISVAPDFKSAKDISVSGSGTEALKEFAVRAEAVLLKNTSTASKSEVAYLQSAVQNDDKEALEHIASIAKAYRDSAVGISMLSVPKELVAENLILINALMRMSQITADFARVRADPLATILALKQYPQAALSLGTAFINIGKIYKNAGISLSVGEQGASFVNVIADIISEQEKAKKP